MKKCPREPPGNYIILQRLTRALGRGMIMIMVMTIPIIRVMIVVMVIIQHKQHTMGRTVVSRLPVFGMVPGVSLELGP